jgi:CRP-like cAMP-binding protein
MHAEFEALIARLEAIHPLPPGGRERILAISRLATVAKGGYFLHAGERPARVGFMTEGWLRYFHTDAEGREYIRYFCSGNNFVSSQSALVKGEPSEFSIQAIEDSRLVVFEYRRWLALTESHPAWGIIHQAILDQALMAAERRERSLILEDAAARYGRFLEEYPGVEDHVRQYDIASYLGISPVTLSRIRGSRAASDR